MARSKAGGPIVVHEPLQQGHQQDLEDKAIDTMWSSDSLKLNRSILTGTKGPTTPVPSWKMYENPFYEGIMAAVQTGAISGRDAAVSARKLAATLWGLQKHSKPVGSSSTAPESNPEPTRTLPSPQQSTDSNGKVVQTNRQIAALRSHVHRLLERRAENKDTQITSPNNQQLIGIEAQRKDLASSSISNEIKNVDVGGPPTTANELLRVLSRIRDLEEQNTSSTSLAAALRVELDHARTCVQELEIQHKAARKEIESLQKKIVEERANWRTKEQENMKSAIQAAKEEVDEEKKSKRRLESANKKLVKDLVDANASLSRMSQDLERERKAREMMENVCDDLAKEIAEDKAEVEELKRVSTKVREEVEEERKMLQVAEVWREERVQMKLAAAQHELEERATALNSLRMELEDFLDCRRFDARDDPKHQQDIREAESLCIAVEALQRDMTSFLPGWKDDQANLVHLGTQPESCTVNSTGNYEADMSQVDENGTFSKEQKSRTKSSKHKGRTNLLESLKKSQPRSKPSKQISTKEQHNVREGANTSDSKGKKPEITVYENAYSKLNLDESSFLSDSDDGHVNADLHPVNEIQRIIELHTSEEGTAGPDLQGESSNNGPVWRSNSLVTEKHHSNIEESVTNQQGRRPASPPPQVHTSKTLASSAPQAFNLSSGITSHTDSWIPTDSKNPHITRGIKGSIEWSKNVRDNSLRTKLEKQQGRLSWKTVR
ncbi:hypothetical protein O6H91_Y243800 [Diphasiastrum complanatum]|nr:hypothetical protein O6H91_Y243800 [Diphasiastrum complanatum]